MQSFVKQFHDRLSRRYELSERNALLRLLAEEVWGYTPAQFLLYKNSILSENLRLKGEEILLRLEKGEPVQYILQRVYFFGLSLQVAPGVLIPRPETEELVELILTHYRNTRRALCLLDIGTGSGCIALALAHELEGCSVTAWDISASALLQARANADRLGLEIGFEWVDVLNWKKEKTTILPGSLDLIVSNPPYVLACEAADMEEIVLAHEPHGALFVPNDDPLRFYRAIAEAGQLLLTTGGMLWFEINALLSKEMKSLLYDFGYKEVTCYRDLSGKERFVSAIR